MASVIVENEAPGEFLLDFHVHTRSHSFDSSLAAAEAAMDALARGLCAIVLTEHNALWSRQDQAELSDRHGLHVIAGMEIGTDVGHVLAFGLDRFTPELTHIDTLRRIASSEGAVLVLAHPLRPPGFGRPHADLAAMFDGYEVLNGDESRLAAQSALAVARQFGLAQTGGSDAHSARGLGRCFTRFEAPVHTVEALATALRSRACEAVRGPGALPLAHG